MRRTESLELVDLVPEMIARLGIDNGDGAEIARPTAGPTEPAAPDVTCMILFA
jgi:hypothetical protein